MSGRTCRATTATCWSSPIRSALAQDKLRRDKERADREIREARDRAELLLSEVNHRVANSLALVSSLARLQAKGVADESARLALHEMQARIAAIAGVHRRLYTSPDVRSVDMDIYLASLVRELGAAMRPRPTLTGCCSRSTRRYSLRRTRRSRSASW